MQIKHFWAITILYTGKFHFDTIYSNITNAKVNTVKYTVHGDMGTSNISACSNQSNMTVVISVATGSGHPDYPSHLGHFCLGQNGFTRTY